MHSLIKEIEPGGDSSVFSRVVETVMRWGYIPKVPPLYYVAEKHFEKILENWQREDFKNTPISKFAREVLPMLGPRLIDQVIQDMKSYLDLLQVWPDFVEMIEKTMHSSPVMCLETV